MAVEKKITLVVTNRNRDLRIVKNNLDSLDIQSTMQFDFFLVDYGSDLSYKFELKKLLENYNHVTLIECHTEGQLWNKCRSINIALKECVTPYFIVGDIDLIFHPNFIQKAEELAKDDEVHYFQYGFLAEEESLKKKDFEDFEVDFNGSDAVTGTTMFPTKVLKSLNGYDEFYHGWGAEDTDIHIRMKNKGLSVLFYDKEILVKHQWHPKAYRSKLSTHPFHSILERINQTYIKYTEKTNRTVVNQFVEWGKRTDEKAYKQLENPTYELSVSTSALEVKSLISQLKNFKDEVLKIEVIEVPQKVKIKNKLKQLLGKRYTPQISLEAVNDLLLEQIVNHYRICPYRYKFDRQAQKIEVTINLQ